MSELGPNRPDCGDYRPGITVEEAARPDETALDRLRAAHHCWPLVRALTGQTDVSQLSREDWLRPLKLTGGRVCLRFDGEISTSYVRRQKGGLFEQVMVIDTRSVRKRSEISPGQVVRAIDEQRPDVVTIEETPFAEDPNGVIDDG
jgi:hypothetical protein